MIKKKKKKVGKRKKKEKGVWDFTAQLCTNWHSPKTSRKSIRSNFFNLLSRQFQKADSKRKLWLVNHWRKESPWMIDFAWAVESAFFFLSGFAVLALVTHNFVGISFHFPGFFSSSTFFFWNAKIMNDYRQFQIIVELIPL